MLQPIENAPTSRAPRFAASMMPGPPPVITVKPMRPIAAAHLARERVVADWLSSKRAEPKTVTQGPTKWSARKPRTSSAKMRSARRSSARRLAGPARKRRSLWFVRTIPLFAQRRAWR